MAFSLGGMLSSASAQTADYLYGIYSTENGSEVTYGSEWQLREIKIANPSSGNPTVTHSAVPALGSLNSYVPGYGVTAGRYYEYINGLAVDSATNSVYFNYTYSTDSSDHIVGNYYLQVYKANFNPSTNSWTVVNIRTAAGLSASWGPYVLSSGGAHPLSSGGGAFPRAAVYTQSGTTYYLTGGQQNDSIWRINVNNPADLFTNDDFDHRSDMESFNGGDWVVSGGTIYTASTSSSVNYWVTQTLNNAYSTSSSADAVYFSYDAVVPYASEGALQIAGLGGVSRLYGVSSSGGTGKLYRIDSPNGGSGSALGIVDLGVFYTTGRFSDLSEGLAVQLAPIAPTVDLNSTPTSSTNTTFGPNLVTNGAFSSGGSSPPSPWVEGSSSNGAVSSGRWVWTDGVTSGATLAQPLSIPAPTTSTNTSGGVTTTTTTTNALDAIIFDFGWANTADGTSALTVSYNNVVYGTFNSASGDSSSATGYWTFSNGATGNPNSTTSITSLTSGVVNFVEIYLPTGVVTNSGNLTFNWTSTSSGDDVVLDNIVAELATTTTTTTETADYDWTANYTTGAPAVSIADTDSSVTDPDSTHIVSAKITLTNPQAGDVLSVITTLPSGITASSYNPTTGVITLTGSATKANYANAIERIGFSSTSSVGTPRTISVVANDGALNSNAAITTVNFLVDSDGDGIDDSIDLDDDNDGIPDTVELATAINGGDTDGDGIPDILDLDSDNDGILDFVEARNLTPAQVDALDANNDGRLDGAVGTDGIPNIVQASPNAGTVTYTPLDTDGDSRPDFQDLDADNDGINDVREANGTDGNGDGLADGTVATNGIRSSVPAGGLVPPDTDSDGKQDFRDLDTDNDGINDVVEAGLSDPDNNGIVGSGQVPSDTDADGIANVVDGVPAVFGDSGDTAPLNSDNDPVPNYRDLDSDNDTISDVIEGGNGPADTNGDGTISPTESGDTDGDGIRNIVDNNPSVYGDAGNPALPEGPDADTIPDYIDTDSDGDGITDLVESGKDPAVLDPNGDGMVDNPTDPDGDGIPNNNGNDTIPGGFAGVSPPTTPTDSDNDGIPDVVDLDDDNDGIPDTVELATAINGGDTDGDGIPDILDLDSDNDGILDFVEARNLTPAQVDALDANNDGRLDGTVGTDGIPDVVQSTPNAGVVTYTPLDFDGDSRPDFQDMDTDNDGINDVREANGTDANADGLADGTTGASGIRSTVPAGGLVPPNTDDDNWADFRDLDTDNDGINDVVEAGLSDPDNNGIVGNGQVPTDTDGDGIANVVDGSPTFGDDSDPLPLNSDNDPVPNYRDLDSDNDTVSDVIEGGNGPADTDGDGTISLTESGDTDNDGIPNSVDNTPSVYGDAGNPALPEGPDADTIPDYIDTDSDGDGLTDLVESGKDPAVLDPNGDGQVDNPTDPDGDGIPNNNGNDNKPAVFGGTSTPTTPEDSDSDGLPDTVDLDDDNDGIPDTVELATAINSGDTDGDGVPDILDLDSDNDGILDFVEARNLTPAQVNALDANNDGRLDGTVGTDGIPDVVQSTPNAGVVTYTPLDTDGDSRPDFQDLDADNDGINDVREANGADANGDGLADGIVGTNGIRSTVPAGGLVPPDTDSDGTQDFRDLDTDNDGINDVTEAGLPDPDNNGIVGSGQVPTDTDSDGIPNVVDGVPAVFGDSGDTAPLNSDNDPVPDFRDLDSDNDTVSDVIEGGNGPADTDGDGTISPTESGDTDGDGIPNIVDNNPNVYGDAGNTPVPNTDGNGPPDFQDPDSDDDGITDLVESGKNPAVLDPDGDGMVDNPSDPDGDGIPNNNGNDTKPGDFGGASPPSSPDDHDGDGIPDTVDLDDDNDGIPDTVEIANAINGGDTDGDGVPDYLDLDSDGDGILDVIEAGHVGLDTNHDGRVDTLVSSVRQIGSGKASFFIFQNMLG